MKEPSYAKLIQLWYGIVERVKHANECRDPECKCDNDPPSLFETLWVREFEDKLPKGGSPP